MRKVIGKLAAVVWMLAMFLTIFPVNLQAAADTEPVFKKVYTEMYENQKTAGVYTLTIKNVKKGYIVNWKITGGGKAYATLEAKKTVAAKKAVTNKVTVNGKADPAFIGKKIKITATINDSKNKLVKTLTMTAALKCQAKAITIDSSAIDDLNQLTAGQSYQFKAAMSPENATSTLYWKVTNASGADVSSEMNEEGGWTPSKAGTYTILAYAKNKKGGKTVCKQSVKATVGTFIETVTQTASNAMEVEFNENVSGVYKKESFQIRAGTAAVTAQNVTFSDDGKTAYVTTAANFTDKNEYTVSCGANVVSFTASVGAPASVAILTKEVQVGKETPIQYVFYDAKKIDVTNTVTGDLKFTGDITNGILIDNKLMMQTVGKTASITLSYSSSGGDIKLVDSKVITCVSAVVDKAGATHLTVTGSSGDVDAAEQDVRSISVGDEGYVHFFAFDTNGKRIVYDSVSYASTDANALIVDTSSGRLTPVKPGKVGVQVTVKQGEATENYSFTIEVRASRYLSSLELSAPTVVISNAIEPTYQKRIEVIGRDQYGDKLRLTNETGTIKALNGNGMLASYDAAQDAVIVKAQGVLQGTYQYDLTVARGTEAAVNVSFTVVVQAPVYNNSAISYVAEPSMEKMDMQVDDTLTADRKLTVRLAEYRGGIFCGYRAFSSAEIRKGEYYYNTNLQDRAPQLIAIGGSDTLTLTPVALKFKSGDEIGTCTKAEQGTYVVTLRYADMSGNMSYASANVVLTDSQNTTDYTVRSLTATKKASTALELVNSCLEVSSGTIVGCTAVGTTKTGNEIPVNAGQQLHINEIVVRSIMTLADGRRVYVDQTLLVDKTLTNGN